eukprot:CAMPEP_0176078714 /NCGR_PEP_ID=MMETSP0120_2-20121206/39364_1 /TAXON_ID=160619 /ORGANISM="Kryptoperidinium foliaceum, Strain CCMP 1326" /LENGTH=372 /DNA_ID=CAMNT_0017412461 /DNA_START=27 /DNA_END=1144 /DNA_ORIENTATION=-
MSRTTLYGTSAELRKTSLGPAARACHNAWNKLASPDHCSTEVARERVKAFNALAHTSPSIVSRRGCRRLVVADILPCRRGGPTSWRRPAKSEEAAQAAQPAKTHALCLPDIVGSAAFAHRRLSPPPARKRQPSAEVAQTAAAIPEGRGDRDVAAGAVHLRGGIRGASGCVRGDDGGGAVFVAKVGVVPLLRCIVSLTVASALRPAVLHHERQHWDVEHLPALGSAGRVADCDHAGLAAELLPPLCGLNNTSFFASFLLLPCFTGDIDKLRAGRSVPSSGVSWCVWRRAALRGNGAGDGGALLSSPEPAPSMIERLIGRALAELVLARFRARLGNCDSGGARSPTACAAASEEEAAAEVSKATLFDCLGDVAM